MAGSCCLWCGKKLSPERRKDARYCNSSCRAEASRVRKTQASGTKALRGATGGSRRASRDGRGTRIYVTGREIDLLERALTKQSYVMQGAEVPLPKVNGLVVRLRGKLGRAAERARR